MEPTPPHDPVNPADPADPADTAGPASPPDVRPHHVPDHAVCKSCGYALAGLQPTGVCPECGYSIEKSLLDNALVNSSPEYLESLHKGISMITLGILLMVATTVLGVLLLVATSFSQNLSQSLIGGGELLLSGILSLLGFLILFGWWKFTVPDPAFVGREDGSKARQVLRVAVIASAAAGVISLIFEFASFLTAPPAPAPGQPLGMATGTTLVIFLAGIAGLVSMVAFAVQFFAAMLYLRWIAPRIPDPGIYKRAKTFMWLGPVLYIPGALLCGLGPLIALVMYWNLLDQVRKDIKAIRAQLGLI